MRSTRGRNRGKTGKAIYTASSMDKLPDAMDNVLKRHYGDVSFSADRDDAPVVLVAMIGCPASGKSTAKSLLMASDCYGLNTMNICPDDIRQALTGDAADQSVNALAWKIATSKLHDSLSKKGNMVVFDATASHVRDRKRLHDAASQHDALFVELWCDTPLETCIQRNAQRDRVVPPQVLARMDASIRQNPPTDDTFADDIIVVKNG